MKNRRAESSTRASLAVRSRHRVLSAARINDLSFAVTSFRGYIEERSGAGRGLKKRRRGVKSRRAALASRADDGGDVASAVDDRRTALKKHRPRRTRCINGRRCESTRGKWAPACYRCLSRRIRGDKPARRSHGRTDRDAAGRLSLISVYMYTIGWRLWCSRCVEFSFPSDVTSRAPPLHNSTRLLRLHN